MKDRQSKIGKMPRTYFDFKMEKTTEAKARTTVILDDPSVRRSFEVPSMNPKIKLHAHDELQIS